MEKYEGEVKKLYDTGDVIVEEGEKSLGFFILLSGKVGVYKDSVKITEFSDAGLIFGELGIILDKPRTATVKAIDPTVVLYIKTNLDDLIFRFPNITSNLLYNLAERLYNTTGEYAASVKLLENEVDLISTLAQNESI